MSDLVPSHGWSDEQIEEMVRNLLEVATPEEILSIHHEIRQEEVELQTVKSPFQERYWNDPVAFCRNCVIWKRGEGLTAYQEEIIGNLPIKKRVCQRGPHGLGKTTGAALIILWFALTRDGFDWKCITTASNDRQLKQFLWPEIHKWSRRLRWDRIGRKPLSSKTELIGKELKLRTGRAFAATASDPAGIEGAHAEHLLYVFDESKAIPDGIFDAAEGAFSSGATSEAYALASSTPGEPQGRFWAIQTNEKGRYDDWWARAVTMEEVIAAGRMTHEWAQRRAIQWGEHSFIYLNRVKGEFAAQGKDSVIPTAWVELAQERWHERQDQQFAGVITFGVDVADEEGADKTVVAIRVGKRLVEVHDWIHEDTMGTARRVYDLYTLWTPERVQVDSIGIGAGVFARLRELGVPVVAFVASHGEDSPVDDDPELKFKNLRAAAWWSLRKRLHPQLGEGLELHPHEDVLPDLTAPNWRMPEQRVIIESKDEIRKRLKKIRDESGGSTDVGDAVVMAFWDGAAGIYEEAYGVHTDGTLRAAGVKMEEELTEEERIDRHRKWENEKLFGRPDEEGYAVDLIPMHGEYGGYRL